MLTVGITGGIGSGKSVVCKIFKILGVPVYDADTAAKKLYDTDDYLKQQILSHFGDEVYAAGKFNREKMSLKVFDNPEKLSLLNSLVHPRVMADSDTWFEQQTSKYAIKEAALLIESGAYKKCHKTILVSCPIDKRIARVMKRDKVTYDEVMKRMQYQMHEEEKRTFCDYEIYNDEQDLLIPQVLTLHNIFNF